MYQVVGLYFEGHGCFVVLGGFEAVAATAWFVRQPFGGVEALGGAAPAARRRSWRLDSDRVAALARTDGVAAARCVARWLTQGT